MASACQRSSHCFFVYPTFGSNIFKQYPTRAARQATRSSSCIASTLRCERPCVVASRKYHSQHLRHTPRLASIVTKRQRSQHHSTSAIDTKSLLKLKKPDENMSSKLESFFNQPGQQIILFNPQYQKIDSTQTKNRKLFSDCIQHRHSYVE